MVTDVVPYSDMVFCTAASTSVAVLSRRFRRVDGNEMQVIRCLLIREATMDFNVGAKSWKERRAQIRQEEISIRDEGLPGR